MSLSMTFAQAEKSDITMVSYEQSWLDNEGTISLKNNTDEVIHNVAFQIVYLDMSGNALDYKDYRRNVEIAPGMTKKIDIPAYERSRNYHYYKTKDDLGNPAFKIKFELKGYNISDMKETKESNSYDLDDYDSDKYTLPVSVLIIASLLILGAWIGLYILVAVMAKKRNRNVAMWVFMSIVASPLLIVIILLVIGNEE